METLSQIQLAQYEKVAPPRVERSNFSYSFNLLPKEERSAINTIYAFCSYIDNIVDESPSQNSQIVRYKMERLDWWENEINRIYLHNVSNPLIMPLSKIIHRFKIPKQYFLTLIDGVRRDLTKTRYETFEDLKDYCYSVASVVGLISIEIFGYKFEETKNYAINLGYALQLTNILRDVKADKDRGFIYLPQEDLRAFDYTEDDLMNNVYNSNFVELMQFQANRAREYYHKARKSLRPEEKARILSAEIMDAIYYRLLEKIELNDFDIFRKKIRVSASHKLLITLKHWLSTLMFVKRIKKLD